MRSIASTLVVLTACWHSSPAPTPSPTDEPRSAPTIATIWSDPPSEDVAQTSSPVPVVAPPPTTPKYDRVGVARDLEAMVSGATAGVTVSQFITGDVLEANLDTDATKVLVAPDARTASTRWQTDFRHSSTLNCVALNTGDKFVCYSFEPRLILGVFCYKPGAKPAVVADFRLVGIETGTHVTLKQAQEFGNRHPVTLPSC